MGLEPVHIKHQNIITIPLSRQRQGFWWAMKWPQRLFLQGGYCPIFLSLSLSHVSTIQNDPIFSLFSDHKRKIKLTFAASEFIDTV